MTKRYRYAFAALTCLIVAALVAACGGDDDGPTPSPTSASGRAVVELNVASPVPAEALTTLQNTIKARLDAAGVDATYTKQGEKQLQIDYTGTRDTNFVTQLLTASGVVFKEPQLDGTAIKCKDTSGNDFTIEPDLLAQQGNLPICVDANAKRGEVQWQAAVADVNGVEIPLTGKLIPSNQVVVKTNDDGTEVLNADFNADGVEVLRQVSSDLVGYPLGVFLGDSLLLAAQFQRPITNGRITLAGASVDVMEELAAIIKGGELTSPVTLISIE